MKALTRTVAYKPQTRQREILAAAWEHVQSVPYSVSLRWLFYRLLQDGYYSTKADYRGQFVPLMSRARHRQLEGWRPDTLTDDVRSATYRGTGPTDEPGFMAMAIENVPRLFPQLSHWQDQAHYLEIWFEAAAMRSQFAYYTEGIILRPFGGDPSIPYLYRAACELAGQAEEYGKPAAVLYFGDRDDKGETIARSAERHAREWCAVDFLFVRCGLTADQAETMNVPENPDKPGAYQWEALTDDQAREIIRQGTAPYIDQGAIDRARELRARLVAELTPRLQTAVKRALRRKATE